MMKNISSSFRITTKLNGLVAVSDSFCLENETFRSSSPLSVRANAEVEFLLEWDDSDLSIRIRLGNDIIEDLPPGKTRHNTASEKCFQGYMGESCLIVEARPEEEQGQYSSIYQLDLFVEARPETAQDFKAMVDELVTIHVGLAQDVVSRSFTRKIFQREIPKAMVPGAMLEKLERLLLKLSESIALIAVQPSSQLVQKECRTTYRPGDRINLGTLNSIARDGFLPGNPHSFVDPTAKINVERPALSEDIPEHRHMAFRIKRLANIATQIKSHCDRSVTCIEADQIKWGKRRGDTQSVFELVGLPRIKQLNEFSQKAALLARKFSALLLQNRFLAEAGMPRTKFGLTPLFYGHPAYRSVYQAMREAEQVFAGIVDGDAVRSYFRSLAVLYEYWCFIKTVSCLREWFGPPEPFATFQFIDEVYRPEFSSGQAFEFNVDDGRKVRVTYEPEIRPWNEARAAGDKLGATLTTTSLRPDIFIELLGENYKLAGMVLDAKSGDYFYRQKLRDISDYSRQILDVQTGGQPVRHVFLLHRDRSKREETNIPGYFERFQNMVNLHVIGSAPCYPLEAEIPNSLERIIKNFLSMHKINIPGYVSSKINIEIPNGPRTEEEIVS